MAIHQTIGKFGKVMLGKIVSEMSRIFHEARIERLDNGSFVRLKAHRINSESHINLLQFRPQELRKMEGIVRRDRQTGGNNGARCIGTVQFEN